MLVLVFLKHLLTGRKEIIDLTRRMGLQSTKYHIMDITWRPQAGGASHIKRELQMGGIPDYISICSLKTPETGLNEITDLNRRMGPPVVVNKISHDTCHSCFPEAC
jgi:hypothetical protein